MRFAAIFSLMFFAACAAHQGPPVHEATRVSGVPRNRDTNWHRLLPATEQSLAGFASEVHNPFLVALMIAGPRDGYLVRIDPAAVPANIERMYVERQWAGGYPLPDDEACIWTREQPTCAFVAPAGWGMGFAVASRPWWIPPRHGERGYEFYTGDVAVELNGEPADIYTVFGGGPNNLRIYGVRGREIAIDRDEETFRGAMPVPSLELSGWQSSARQ